MLEYILGMRTLHHDIGNALTELNGNEQFNKKGDWGICHMYVMCCYIMIFHALLPHVIAG